MIKRLCEGLIHTFQKERLIVLCQAHQGWDRRYDNVTFQIHDLDILKICCALDNDIEERGELIVRHHPIFQGPFRVKEFSGKGAQFWKTGYEDSVTLLL